MQFVGLNVADQPDHARVFVDGFNWTFPSIEDPDRSLAAVFGAAYQPFYVLLDQEGKLVGRTLSGGPPGWGALLDLLPGDDSDSHT